MKKVKFFFRTYGGKHDESSIIDILENLLTKGETKDELAGGIYILREKASKVNTDENTIDTCGTGGDGQNSLNISTAAAIVLASMGVKLLSTVIKLSHQIVVQQTYLKL